MNSREGRTEGGRETGTKKKRRKDKRKGQKKNFRDLRICFVLKKNSIGGEKGG